MLDVVLTVDLEPDCPPYLRGWRGMERGAPLLLELLEDRGIPATFFTTGETAERFPETVRTLVAGGHELAGHGHTHRAFPELDPAEARDEIRRSTDVLGSFAEVTAFRAPYLRFPEAYLPLLEEAGYRLDASRARYKPAHWGPPAPSPLRRLPASVTSSALRLPAWLRDPYLRLQRSPVVLFVHPWEFVDLTGERLRWDCRLGTGAHALRSLGEVLDLFRGRGARFLRAREVETGGDRRGAA